MSLKEIVEGLVLFINAISILILIYGVVKATISFIYTELFKNSKQESELDKRMSINRIKYQLGTYILLSLEVLIAADIIESIINPTYQDLIILAGVVIIRTAISFFLAKEIENSDEE